MDDELKLKHKTPCKECPWRRNSPAGFLGGVPIDWFVERSRWQAQIACHRSVGASKTPVLCAGFAIHLRNSCSTPRDPKFAAEIEKVSESTDVFMWSTEFEAHHNDKEGWIKRTMEKTSGR